MKIKKIIIGVDNSKFSDHATQYGFDIAHQFKASVGLVHIVESTVMPITNTTDPVLGTSMQDLAAVDPEVIDIQNKATNKLLDDIVQKYAGDLSVSVFNEYGDTADGIVNCSKEFNADMIVIGTHNRSGIDRLIMGSVAEHVVRHSTIPVLVVPFQDATREE